MRNGAILVTGASGFLGRHVVAELAARGQPAGAFDIAFPAPLPEGVDRLEGSILDPDGLARAMTGVAAVIHCAAINDFAPRPRVRADRVNTRGTCEVLAAARRARARVVHVSDCATLVAAAGAPGQLHDGSERRVPSALTGRLARTKREAELAVEAAVRVGLHAVTVLPGMLAGAGGAATPLGRFLRDLMAGRVRRLPEGTVNVVDVRAVAAAVVAALDRGASGRRWLLTGEDLRFADLAEMTNWAPPRGIALWRQPAIAAEWARLAACEARFDNARAGVDLGFAPSPATGAVADMLAEIATAPPPG